MSVGGHRITGLIGRMRGTTALSLLRCICILPSMRCPPFVVVYEMASMSAREGKIVRYEARHTDVFQSSSCPGFLSGYVHSDAHALRSKRGATIICTRRGRVLHLGLPASGHRRSDRAYHCFQLVSLSHTSTLTNCPFAKTYHLQYRLRYHGPNRDKLSSLHVLDRPVSHPLHAPNQPNPSTYQLSAGPSSSTGS